MAEEFDEMADYLRAGVSIHPDTLKQYRQCMSCADGECQSCKVMLKEGLSKAMAGFLRKRMPFPSL